MSLRDRLSRALERFQAKWIPVRVNGTEMDIHFLRGKHAKKRSDAASKADEMMN